MAASCPSCGSAGGFGEPHLVDGAVRTRLDFDDGQHVVHYLRPDPTQGILMNFANVVRSARR